MPGTLRETFIRLVPSRNPQQTLALFYLLVCVPFRMALYSTVFIMKDEPYIFYLTASAALLAAVHLISQPSDVGQWWSRRFQLTIALSVVLTSLLTLSKVVPSTIVPLLLYTSLLGGLLQFLWKMI